MDEPLLTQNDVAALLKVSKQTLFRWRQLEQGPPFIQVEGSIRYRRDAVDTWLAERTLGGTLPA